MRTLIVNCSGFALEHNIVLQDEGVRGFEEIAQLPTAEIAGYATHKNVDKIILSGITDYCFGLKDEISTQLMTEYANNNIEIEVM